METRLPRRLSRSALLAVLALEFSAASALSAETAPAAAPTPAKPEATAARGEKDEAGEPVVMSPFTVSSDRDQGYRATNSISGTRLNTPIKEIPMPIEVITEKFVRDTGSNNLRDTLRYSAGILLQSQNDQGTPGGAYQGMGSVNNPEGATANKTQTSIKIRGYVTDTVLRDGYRRQNSTDSVNIGRVEVIRGPAALLYGIGNFGGIVNYLPKTPGTKAAGEATVSVGSYGFRRGTIDYTAPINDQFAYRITGAVQETDDYTDFLQEKHYFVSPVVTWKPTATTEITFDLEHGKQEMDGIGFQRVRASANVGVGNDQNEHSGFWTLPGTNARSFRWSGPDTFSDTEATNLRIQATQKILENLYFLVGYNKSKVKFDQRDVQGNLVQNQGPAGLRSIVALSPLDQVKGSSNLNIQFGAIPNTIFQYFWTAPKSEVERDQVRAELNYNFKLFEGGNKWLKIDNAFLLGRSDERADNSVTTWRTPQNQWNWKNPNDATGIRFGKQGDGSADVAMIKFNGENSTGWNQGHYLVYQGKLLDDRLTIVAGGRRDRSTNAVTTFDYVNPGTNATRQPHQVKKTYQYGATFRITDELSIYALKADGLQPNFNGGRDTDGTPLGSITAKSKEVGLKVDLFQGKISGTVSAYEIKRTGTPIFYWWAPTSNYKNFNASKPIVYNVSNFSPSTVAGGSNGGNGAAESAITQWNAGVAAGAIYQKVVGGNNNWYVNASQATGAAYLDAVFDYTKSHGMSWPGWLYNYDTETNNSWDDRASGPGGNEYVVGTDSSKGWDAQLMFTPSKNLQFLVTYAHVERVIDSAGKFAKSPNPQDRWAVWYFPNTDWGLTGKPLATVYTNAADTSTWTGIGYGTGEKQDDTPSHQVSFWSNYNFTDGALNGLTVGVGGWWESEREFMSGITHGGGQRVTDKNGNLVVLSTADRLNIDLMARYAFKLHGHDSSVQINISNLLNDQKRYGLIYSMPTTARLEFSYKF